MTNVPEDSYRTWTFFKTSERMKIECNGVQVWEIAFADDSESCAASLSKASHSFLFKEYAAMFYRAAGKSRELCVHCSSLSKSNIGKLILLILLII